MVKTRQLLPFQPQPQPQPHSQPQPQTMKPKIILIGGGGHCKACIDVIEQENKYSIAGIVDLPEKKGSKILGYEIIAHDDEIPKLVKDYPNFLITMGQITSPEPRIRLFEWVKQHGGKLPFIISPIAYVSNHAIIEKGTIVMHQAMVNAGATIGKNCIINNKALIEHDASIGDHCHISTAAVVNGGVKIGEKSFYGSGAVSKQYIEIPANSFIKANSIAK